MSITLHTGVPGSCKSLSMIDAIEHDKEYQGRRVLAHAIEGWERATRLQCQNSGCRACRDLGQEEKRTLLFVEDWQQWVQQGDLICVDEAHYAFPMRRDTKMPQYIERLTEHRHDGCDFWLCTPNANLLDINVRRLVEHHVHFEKGAVNRFKVSHTRCMDNDSLLRQGSRTNFRLPKRSFDKYKSADAHVTIKRALPRKVYYIAAAAVASVGVIYYAISLLGSYGARDSIRKERAMVSEVGGQSSLSVASGVEERSRFFAAGDRGSVVSRRAFWSDPASVDFSPRVDGYPGSAPAYDLATVDPVIPPRIAGCIAKEQERVCVCYSQQATVVEVSRLVCLENIHAPKYLSQYDDAEYWGSGGAGGRSGAPPAPPASVPLD